MVSKRFLRFGRGLSPDPYYKLSRQFFRLNRSYQPYQDKRFLRFGRSQFQGLDDLYNADVAEPFSRKRRSIDTNDQLDVTHNHVRRSVDQSAIEKPEEDETSKLMKKRSADDYNMSALDGVFNRDETPKTVAKRSISQTPYMSFGLQFRRGDDEDVDDDSENEGGFEKRFMRFGKRYLPTKRFMRFGRNQGMMTGDDMLAEAKRFMRFGKRKNEEISSDDDEDVETVSDEARMQKLSNVLSLANRLKSEAGELDGGLYATQKRFMRFGKRNTGAEGLGKEN